MDKALLERLFRDYADDVYRLAYSYLGSRTDAEDVCQTVFLNLAAGNVQLWPEKEKNWLLTCTANACKSQLRSLRRRQTDTLDENLPLYEADDRALHDAVLSLPPKYRAVIHLYYFEGYDQGEIAGILNLSRTAVQTRMSRARDILKKELKENDETLSSHDGADHAG